MQARFGARVPEVPEMLRRLAEAEALPVESEAPEAQDSAVPYDPGLQAELTEHGPEALREFGMIVVRDVGREERYNSAVWYALAQDPPLRYELRDGCVIITDPTS